MNDYFDDVVRQVGNRGRKVPEKCTTKGEMYNDIMILYLYSEFMGYSLMK